MDAFMSDVTMKIDLKFIFCKIFNLKNQKIQFKLSTL